MRRWGSQSRQIFPCRLATVAVADGIIKAELNRVYNMIQSLAHNILSYASRIRRMPFKSETYEAPFYSN